MSSEANLKKDVKEKNVICCDLCFESIAKLSPKSARLWLELCDLFVLYQGIFGFAKSANAEVKVLENMGYLVTHENEYQLLVKMIGYHPSPCFYFCKGDCNGTCCE